MSIVQLSVSNMDVQMTKRKTKETPHDDYVL